MNILSPSYLCILSVLCAAFGNALITLDTIRNLTRATDAYRERILEVGDVDLGRGLRDAVRGAARQAVLGQLDDSASDKEGVEEVRRVHGNPLLGSRLHELGMCGKQFPGGRALHDESRIRRPEMQVEHPILKGCGYAMLRHTGGLQGFMPGFFMRIYSIVAAALRKLCTDLFIELEKPLTTTPPPSPSSEKANCDTTKKEYHEFLASTVRFLYVVQEIQMAWHWGRESAVHDGVAWMQGLWASRRRNSQNRSFIEQQMSLYAETGCFGKSKEVLRRDVEVVEYLNDIMDSFA
ncbi:uncharacterized protein RCO7_06286 [Rhynchosporium graminicola]|uniref:Uncharacterized protein n=1 Tax=Rhynchosporium graminicola TaxID=2792576 RepID=A0A1E1KW86_9HELO|nr:uncharacterized protein RCO7_06286 [Rhynchosporium commune]